MTREEEVEIISERYGANSLMYGKLHNDTLKGLLKHYQKGFVAGVKWADKNPKSLWISVDEDLPCNHDELILYGSSTKLVLVSDHKGCVSLLRMKKRSNGIIGVEPWWQWEIPAVIYYWMPIQELPKE